MRLAVGIPLGLYLTTVVAYLVFQISRDAAWFRAGYAANVVAIWVGLVAIMPSFLQWLLADERQTRVVQCTRAPLWMSLLGLVMFTAVAWMQDGSWIEPPEDAMPGLALGLVGLSLAYSASCFAMLVRLVTSARSVRRSFEEGASLREPISFEKALRDHSMPAAVVPIAGEAIADSSELARAA
jgi:uncharacterized membrane protein